MAAISLLGAATGLAGAAGEWSADVPLPHAVAGSAAAWTHDACWIAGGTSWEGERKQITTGVFRRRAGENAWAQVAEVPGGFAHGGYAGDGEGLWLAGGLTERGVAAGVRRIEFASGRLVNVAQLPEPRLYCGAAVLDGAVWVVGGVAAEGDLSRVSAAGWRIDGATGAVTPLPPGPAWINPLVLALDARLHVLPGGAWSAATGRLEAPEEIFVYTPAERRWEKRRLATRLARGLSGVALDRQRAFVCGGVAVRAGTAAIARGAWLYQAASSWLEPLAPLPGPRLAAAVVCDGRDALVLGGEDRPRGRVATAWRWRNAPAP